MTTTTTTMHQMLTTFTTTFRSKSLLYRAIDDTDTDLHLISSTLYDPVSQGLADPTLYLPQSATTAKENIRPVIQNALLAVLICLPSTPEDTAFLAATAVDPDSTSNKTSDNPTVLPGTHLKKAQARATPIGTIYLSKQRAGSTAHWRWARVGMGIQEEYQNKGYGQEALEWALGWGFQFAGLHRIELGTVSYNERARRLYERVGFVREGVRRDCVYTAGRWWDMVDYGILEGEWRGRVKDRGKEEEGEVGGLMV